MVQDTAPLLSSEPLVKSDGTGTEYFLRQWSLQRNLNTEISGIPALEARVATLETEMDAVQTLSSANALAIVVNSNNITTLQNRNLIAGTGLSGGGDLTADRTFNLEDTAVTPGAYTNANITVDQQGRITDASDGSSGIDGDEFWSNVVLLMHFEGADASTDFIDSSQFAVTTTAEGNAQIDTAQFKFGSSSGVFDGAGDTVDWPDNDRYTLGSGDFTLEGWVRFNGNPSGSDHTLFAHYNSSGSQRAWRLYLTSTGNLSFQYSTNGSTTTSLTSAWSPSGDTWYFVTACRDGTNLRLFVDGVQIGATHNISTNVIFNSTDTPRLGAFGSGGAAGQVLDGWLDECRWTVGVARYTADFTAPTTVFPSGPTISYIEVQDDGVIVAPTASKLNFTGPGVTVTNNDGVADIDIPVDMETGTFTPTIAGSGTPGTFTYSTQQGVYTRIGNIVFVSIVIAVSATSVSPTGNLLINGLPITSGTGISEMMFAWSKFTPPANVIHLTAQSNPGSTQLGILQIFNNGTAASSLTAGALASDFYMRLSGFYFTT